MQDSDGKASWESLGTSNPRNTVGCHARADSQAGDDRKRLCGERLLPNHASLTQLLSTNPIHLKGNPHLRGHHAPNLLAIWPRTIRTCKPPLRPRNHLLLPPPPSQQKTRKVPVRRGVASATEKVPQRAQRDTATAWVDDSDHLWSVGSFWDGVLWVQVWGVSGNECLGEAQGGPGSGEERPCCGGSAVPVGRC